MKNTKRNTFIVFLITIVILFFVLKDDYKVIINNLIVANKWYILFAIILVFIYWLLKSICLYVIVKEYNPKVKLRNMFHQTLITQFFNGITPFSTGGQPMQVYMLKKSGVRLGAATNIIVQDFIMYQMALIVMGILALVANWYYDFFEVSSALYSLIVLGFIINIIVGVVLLFISFSKKFNDFCGKLMIKIATKFKIVKDQEKILLKWEEKLAEFNDSAKLFKKKKMLFLKCFLYNLLALTVYYIIPFYVFISLDSSLSLSIPAVITSSAFILMIGNFVPIPGGSGGIEYGFLQFFNSFANSSIVLSGLIIWRFVTYYLGIIIGGISLGFFKGERKKV